VRNACLEALFVVEVSEYDELMIPQEKSAAVWRGLDEAFGTRSIEDIRRMTRGLSSDLVFRIVVRGSPYLLRIMTRMDERNDPARVFACMKAAAEAGLAPRVLYSNEAEGIAIIDWIEIVPFGDSARRVCSLKLRSRRSSVATNESARYTLGSMRIWCRATWT